MGRKSSKKSGNYRDILSYTIYNEHFLVSFEEPEKKRAKHQAQQKNAAELKELVSNFLVKPKWFHIV